MWAQEAAANASFPSATAITVIGGVIFVLGYRLAVASRARRDYRATKAAVKPLRKAFWGSVWAAVKFGVLVFVAGVLLVAWVVHDVRHGR